MPVVRDVVCLVLGIWGVIHEELSGKANPMVLAIYGIFMVAPGLIAAVWLTQSGTGSPSSEGPPQPQPPQVSSSGG
ncbi:MAG: hypothetical protein ABIS86_17075 [Streptosporangiaceae bacterium]